MAGKRKTKLRISARGKKKKKNVDAAVIETTGDQEMPLDVMKSCMSHGVSQTKVKLVLTYLTPVLYLE